MNFSSGICDNVQVAARNYDGGVSNPDYLINFSGKQRELTVRQTQRKERSNLYETTQNQNTKGKSLTHAYKIHICSNSCSAPEMSIKRFDFGEKSLL